MNIALRNFSIRILDWIWSNFSSNILGKLMFKNGLILWAKSFSFKSPKIFSSASKNQLEIHEFFYDPMFIPTGPVLLGALFIDLIEQTKFKGLHSRNKMILISGICDGEWVTLHKSFLITPYTDIHDFIKYFLSGIQRLENRAYPITQFTLISIKVIPQQSSNELLAPLPITNRVPLKTV